jgi:hypothetical protein
MKPQKSKKTISLTLKSVSPTEAAYYTLYASGYFPNLKNRFKNIIKRPD